MGVLELLTDHMIDVCFVTETWLKLNDVAKFAEIHEMGYEIFNAPRRGTGGGVGFLFNKNRVTLKRNNVKKYSSFEVLESTLQTSTELLRLCVIYRSTQHTSREKYNETKHVLFMDEFADYLDVLASKTGKPLICGDFNYHVEDDSNILAKQFVSLYKSKGFTQHIDAPTHMSAGTLDLVLTRDSITEHLTVDTISVYEDTGTCSDHYFVSFSIPLIPATESHRGNIVTKNIRQLSKINVDNFKADIADRMPSPSSLGSLDEAVSTYDQVLTELLDLHAPLISITVN